MRRVAFLLCLLLALGAAPAALGGSKPPRTGFEERDGAGWTTHAEEIAFLRSVDRGSARASVSVIGRTRLGKPLHLVRVGHPSPRSADRARTRPVALFVCTQHGNEPAGREACLQWLRTLAFTRDSALVDLLTRWTVLFLPTANPDGREANTRENTSGVDINRDHLNVRSREGRAIGTLIRDWRPDVLVDLHEYGPGIPVLYDDDVLYLWPRNLNVDPQVYGLSKSLAVDYVGKGAEAAGFTSDEYGLYAVGDQDVAQTAGDQDEGILRNAAGLRHTIGILVETRVDMRPSPDELLGAPAVNLRRVASHGQAIADTVRFMREQEELIEQATVGARVRKTEEGRDRSAPVYFGGADNAPPEPEEKQFPPPCGYRLTAEQAWDVSRALGIHGIAWERVGDRVLVTMAQAAEPLIPLLLDERGARSAVVAEAVSDC